MNYSGVEVEKRKTKYLKSFSFLISGNLDCNHEVQNKYIDKEYLLVRCIALKIQPELCSMCAVSAFQVFSASELESRTDLGLVRGHAYSIIGLEEVK